MLKGLFRQINQLLRRGGKVDDDLLEELEELLVVSDVSLATVGVIMARLRERIRADRLTESDQIKEALKRIVVDILAPRAAPLAEPADRPAVYLMVGVNGSGKTTTIAKLAERLHARRCKLLLVAADTFRAAAVEQLGVWAERLGVDLIRGQSGGDPAAVVYDGLQAARARDIDLVLIDTAGRLHTKHNLMEELRKVRRIVERELGRPPDETLLVLDATTGQNALAQAREFGAAVPLTGIVLTKLDGTAKGGTIITLAAETEIAIKLIGTGESSTDLADFNPQAFADSLFE
jgi:fused signal recognition particle receptor